MSLNSETIKYITIVYGWWSAKSKNNIDDATNYIDKQADYYNLTTQVPAVSSFQKSPSTSQILIAALLAVFFMLCFLGLLAHRILTLKYRLVLSNEDVTEFRRGGKDFKGSMDDASQNIYNVPYKKEQYEIENWKFKVDQSCTLIGAGFSSIVYKTIMQTNAHGKVVAVKVPKSKDSQTVQMFLREIKLMSYIGKHENLLSLLGAYTKEIQYGIVHLVFDYHSNGSLLSHLKQIAKTTNQDINDDVLYDLYRFCKEISNGMDYLASKQVVHGDLSTRNILLTQSMVCQICDFGLSRRLYSTELYVKKSAEPMPWKWMSVEALERSEFSLKSDVWSLAVTFWEIFSLGAEPFQGMVWSMDFHKRLRDGLQLPKPQLMADEIYDEIVSCWKLNPTSRPNANDFVIFFGTHQSLVYSL